MRRLAVISILAAVAFGQSGAIKGGTPDVREAFKAFGQRDTWNAHAEVWIEKKFVVMLSKAEGLCDHAQQSILKRDPDAWAHDLRQLNLVLPADPVQRRVIKQQRLLMVVQWPQGTSCAWRLLEPETDWESVPDMVKTRVLGSCADALDAMSKLGASKSSLVEIRSSLAHPRLDSECVVRDAGQ